MKILPSILHPKKMSTATCASVFEELENALMLLNLGRDELSPIQRELASRFISTCETFAYQMLAADGDANALRAVFGLSLSKTSQSQPSPILTDQFRDGVKAVVQEAVRTADAHGLPRTNREASDSCQQGNGESVKSEKIEDEASLTIGSNSQTQFITVTDGWFGGDRILSLPRGLRASFELGYKFHVDKDFVICAGWLAGNAHRNYILEAVHYSGDDEASTCMSSEQDLVESEERHSAGRQRESAVAQAKALIMTGRGCFDITTLDAMISQAQEHLIEASLEEFRKYVTRVPSRLAPHVGELMLNGKSFEDAVELGSTHLHVAAQKKLNRLLDVRKNRRDAVPKN